MSRLQKHQQKKFATKIVSLIIILFFVIYFIFTVGFRLLLNVSAFIANLTSKKQTNQTVKSEGVYGSIYIDSIPTATNSSKIMVGGSVVNLSTVEFYLNSEKVKEIKMNASDYFSEEIGDLKKNQNTVYIRGKLKDSREAKQSKEFNVLYKPDKPKLEVKEPADKSKTSKQEIKIKGETDKETFIKINDFPVVVDANGNFEYTVQLKDGDNSFTVTAEDIAGNVETKTIAVTYQKED
jgi:hypothetical protein